MISFSKSYRKALDLWKIRPCSIEVINAMNPVRHLQESCFEIEIRQAEQEYGRRQVPASSYPGRVRI